MHALSDEPSLSVTLTSCDTSLPATKQVIAFSEIGVKSSFDGLSSNLLNNAGKKKNKILLFKFLLCLRFLSLIVLFCFDLLLLLLLYFLFIFYLLLSLVLVYSSSAAAAAAVVACTFRQQARRS